MSDPRDLVDRPASPTVRERLARVLPSRTDPTWLVVLLTIAFFVVALWYLVWLYQGFTLLGSDFGNYVHIFVTTLDGQGFLKPAKYRAGLTSYWGSHFAVTLLAFLPVFAVFPSPYTLLVANAALIAAGIPMVWVLAREHLGDSLAGVLVISYALNPFVWRAVSIPFQESSLLPVLTLLAYYYYSKERSVPFLIFLALVLLTNEFVTLIVAGFLVGLGAVALWNGNFREKLPVLGIGFVMAIVVKLVSGVVLAHYNRFPGIPVGSVAGPLQPFVSGPRASTGGLLSIMANHPDLVFEVFSQNGSEKILLLVLFLLPVVGLAFFDLPTLFAFAPFLVYGWFFAGKSGYYSFTGHYPLYLVAFVYIGAIRVLVWADADRVTFPRGMVAVAISLLVIVSATGGVTEAVALRHPSTTDDHADVLNEAIDSIPENATLITQNDVYPHVATRPHARYVDAPQQVERWRQLGLEPLTPEYILYDAAAKKVWAGQLRDWFESRLGSEYGLYKRQDGISIYKRGYDGPLRGITTNHPRYEADEFNVDNARWENGDIIGSTGGNGTQAIWYGPYTTLPAGNYTATYHLNVSGSADAAVTLDVTAGEDHRVVAERRVGRTDGWRNVTVAFGLNRTEKRIEFRGFTADGPGTVRFASVTLARQQSSTNRTRNPTRVGGPNTYTVPKPPRKYVIG